MKELDNRTFLLWKCADATDSEGCGQMNIRATKAFLEGGTGWLDLQSRCTNPNCTVKGGRKKRLYRKNTKAFECREDAEYAKELASGRWL